MFGSVVMYPRIIGGKMEKGKKERREKGEGKRII